MSSRRLYEALTVGLAASRPLSLGTSAGYEEFEHIHGLMTAQWRADCYAVAGALASVNPAFDRERFLKDCGAIT